MNRLWLRALWITIIAVVATQVLSFTVRLLLGAPADYVTMTLATLLPIVITFPLSMFVLRQGDSLSKAHAALVAANAALARKASHDQMTGLLNRESFLEQVDVLRLLPQCGVLLMIDADHFKSINDRFGHLVGDKVLMRIAASISGSLRRGDIVGRLGGEEFSVFLLGADIEEATLVAQRLRRAVELVEFTTTPGEKVAITVSIGGTMASQHDASVESLVERADNCLYEAKNSGRNRVILEGKLCI